MWRSGGPMLIRKWAAKSPVDVGGVLKLGRVIWMPMKDELDETGLDAVRGEVQKERGKRKDRMRRAQARQWGDWIRRQCEKGTAAGHRLLNRRESDILLVSEILPVSSDGFAYDSWLAHLKHQAGQWADLQ